MLFLKCSMPSSFKQVTSPTGHRLPNRPARPAICFMDEMGTLPLDTPSNLAKDTQPPQVMLVPAPMARHAGRTW